MANEEDDTPEAAPKRGFLGALKNLVMEPEEGDGDEAEAPAKPAGNAKRPPPTKGARPAPPGVPGYTPPPPAYTVPGAVPIDDRFMEVLEQDVGAAAKPAYTAFHAVEVSMAEIIANDLQRMQAALKAVAHQGHTVAAVQTDVNECLIALDSREQEVKTEGEKRLNDAVSGLEAQAAKLRTDIETRQKTILQLQQEINQLQQQEQQATASITTERQRIIERTRSLLATVAAMRAKWTGIKQALNQATGAPNG